MTKMEKILESENKRELVLKILEELDGSNVEECKEILDAVLAIVKKNARLDCQNLDTGFGE